MSIYYASIENATSYILGTLRQFTQLSVAWNSHTLWISGLTDSLLAEEPIKTTPGLLCYVERSGTLFPLGSELPCGPIPQLDWQSICAAIPVTIPSYNHNFFEMAGKLPIVIAPSAQEREATAMLVDIDVLAKYMATAPAIRLSALSWAIVDETKALLLGSPLLPLKANAYWRRGHILLPLGFDWEYPNLADIIEGALNVTGDGWIIMLHDGTSVAVPFNNLVPLSRASVRSTLLVKPQLAS